MNFDYGLYHDISSHLKRSGARPATFGRAAVNDPRLVFDLRDGRRPGPKIASRVYRYISECEGRPGQCG